VTFEGHHRAAGLREESVSVNLGEAADYCKNRLGVTAGAEVMRALAELGLLPIFSDREGQWVLADDLLAVKSLLKYWEPNGDEFSLPAFTSATATQSNFHR